MALLVTAAATALATPVISNPPGSGNPINNAGATPGEPQSWVGSAGGVDTATGNKLTTVPIVGWTARGGLPVSLSLAHNSLSLANGHVGPKWTTSYDISLTDDGSGDMTVAWGDGSGYTFMKSGSSYINPPGIHDTLAKSGSTYTLTTKDQIKYTFQLYGTSNLAISIADENGNVIAIGRNTDGTLNTITDPTSRTITFGYYVNGTTKLINLIKDPLGRSWTLSYDANNQYNLIYVYQPTLDQNGHAYIFGYDANHCIASEKDLNGNTWTFHCNTDGTLAYEIDPKNNKTSFGYGASATTITDPNFHTRTDSYNSSGQRIAVADALSNLEYFGYDSDNNLKTDEDRNGYTWTRTYDSMGNVLTYQTPHNAVQGYLATVYTYNAHNRLLTATLPGKESVSVTYDSYGRDNPVKVQQLNASGTVIATTTIDYPYVSATYPTGYGLPDYKTDPNTHKTTYGYDGNWYLSSVTTPLGHKTQWVRNGYLDVVTQRTDANGLVTTYTPDAWLRITSVSYANNSAYNATYGYDYNSNLTAFSNYAGNYTRAYDLDNRMTQEALNGTAILAHTYDGRGQLGLLSTTVDICPRALTYGYTVRNEIASIAETTGTASYTYDDDGNLSNATNENGTQNQDKTRDEDDRLTQQWDVTASNAFLQSNFLTYNADGQITQAVDGFGSTTTYTYDGFLHLSSEVRTGNSPYNRSYVTDALGNRTSMVDGGTGTTLYHDADDEQVTDPGGYRTYAYNANGDQITYYNMGQAASTYAYDPEDRLVSIAYGGGGGVTYAYDALGRQVARATGGVTTSYYYDGANVIDEYNGTSYAQYTWGPSGQVRRGSEFTMYDGLGSVTKITDGSGTPSEQITLDAFGRTQNIGGTSSDPYQYKSAYGYRTDGDGNADGQGIMKVGARYYDPLFGRFITRDKVLSQSPYAYCGGDPSNKVDPNGNSWITDLWKKLFGSKDLVVNQGLELKIDFLLWDLDLGTGLVFSVGGDGLQGGLYATEGNGGGPFDIGGAGLYAGGGGTTGIGWGSIGGFNGTGESFGGEFNNLSGAVNWNGGYKGFSFGDPGLSGGYGAGAYGNVTKTAVIMF